MNSTTYHLGRDWVVFGRWWGYLFALAAVGLIAGFCYDSETIPLGLAIPGALVFGAGGLRGIYIGHFPEVYSIEVSGEGIRRPTSGAWIPWADVVRLRERPTRQRIDLMGPTGNTWLSLEYQLEGFEEVLEDILSRIPMEGFGTESRKLSSNVEIGDGFVSIRRRFRVTRYELSQISSVRLSLHEIGKGNQALGLSIDVAGSSVPIPLSKRDRLDAYMALRTAIGRRTAE